jgi:sterol desaturase/sphingolipid hydroxylase (fatty acid hydroxylase superfamily)
MKKAEQHRMYANPLLELLSISGPKMMVTFHLLISSACALYGYGLVGISVTGITMVGFFVAGFVSWSLAEYVLHRYLFHYESNNKFVKAFHFALHGYHHKHPNDLNRLFMPPVPAFLFLAIFFLLFYLIIGNYAWFFLPGFEIGYLLYSLIHYNIHKRAAPKKLQNLWHHHIIHHYKEPEKAYGVSSRVWDRIFRTMPDGEK